LLLALLPTHAGLPSTAAQSPSPVQGVQVPLGLQSEAAGFRLHSAFAVQSTQRWSVVRQKSPMPGLPPHCAGSVQPTHWWVEVSQRAASALVHCVSLMQPTHEPVVVLQ